MVITTVLLVEPDHDMRTNWAAGLRASGFHILEAESKVSARRLLDHRQVDAMVSDLELADGSGLALLAHAQAGRLHVPVVFVASRAAFRPAIDAMKSGAVHVLEKPVAAADIEEILLSLPRHSGGSDNRRNASVPTMEVRPVAKSAAMKQLLSVVKRVARYDANILLCAESGAGKEVITREIHRMGPRSAKPLVTMNCALLSDDLLEDQLFGHERGAFTGATARKIGVFEAADGGTLFLDEVNEIGLRCQAKLLRALERKEFRRMGGTQKVRVNSRLIFATNASLEEEVKAHRFREDLYYRIKVLTLKVPPLRDRKEDILPLVRVFLEELRDVTGRSINQITPDAIAQLLSYGWPGNVRELKNAIASATLMNESDTLDIGDLPLALHNGRERRELTLPFGVTMQQAEKQLILHYLNYFPTKKQAAKALNIGLRTLYLKLKTYGSPSTVEAFERLSEDDTVQKLHAT